MLMREMIDTEHTHHATTLAAIEAARGQIEEADALAATLRAHGITNAHATGWTIRPLLRTDRTQVSTGVNIMYGATGEQLAQALRAADLAIASLKAHTHNCYSTLRLEGLATPLFISTSIHRGLSADSLREAA